MPPRSHYNSSISVIFAIEAVKAASDKTVLGSLSLIIKIIAINPNIKTKTESLSNLRLLNKILSESLVSEEVF